MAHRLPRKLERRLGINAAKLDERISRSVAHDMDARRKVHHRVRPGKRSLDGVRHAGIRGAHLVTGAGERGTEIAPDEAGGAGDDDRPQRSNSVSFAGFTSSIIRRCSRSSASVPLKSSTLSAELNSADSAPRFSRVRSASSGSIGRIA
jgi:hypothetical protein